jgi:hypothetical protein
MMSRMNELSHIGRPGAGKERRIARRTPAQYAIAAQCF